MRLQVSSTAAARAEASSADCFTCVCARVVRLPAAITSKTVMEKGLAPILQEWYTNRAVLYRDAMSTFVQVREDALLAIFV